MKMAPRKNFPSNHHDHVRSCRYRPWLGSLPPGCSARQSQGWGGSVPGQGSCWGAPVWPRSAPVNPESPRPARAPRGYRLLGCWWSATWNWLLRVDCWPCGGDRRSSSGRKREKCAGDLWRTTWLTSLAWPPGTCGGAAPPRRDGEAARPLHGWSLSGWGCRDGWCGPGPAPPPAPGSSAPAGSAGWPHWWLWSDPVLLGTLPGTGRQTCAVMYE